MAEDELFISKLGSAAELVGTLRADWKSYKMSPEIDGNPNAEEVCDPL
jgi:hypothetical protein